jgi:intraflagellar transport protein 56
MGSAATGTEIPSVEEFISKGDFCGALAVLEFKRRSQDMDEMTLPWMAYCAWHLGDYAKSLSVYDELLSATGDSIYHLHRASCLYYLGRYDEAEAAAQKGPECQLKVRLMFQTSHRQGDEEKLMGHHGKLTEQKEDQLSLASIHYLRSHFQEATDVYKRILLENRDDLALNVYVAMCYYKVRCC